MFWRLRTLLLATMALMPLAAAPAGANPLGAQVVGGSASVQGQGTSTVTVTQQSNSAIINWNTFNIGAGETTKIIQPSSSSVELDRVTGGLGPSQIFGSLFSNGQVFVVNPDGILIGPSGKIDTASFLATTHDISNSDFMAGRYNFAIPGMPNSSIVNQGSITAQTGGFAALVAPGVRNTGTITAKLGQIGLASANSFSLDFYGDTLITLGVNDSIAATVIDVSTGKPLSALVSNEGTLKANGGRVELTAVAARQVVDSVINNTGVIEANSIGTHNGMIVLGAATSANAPAGAPTQTVKVASKISAAGKKKGTTGGTVIVTGENIQVSGAKINASGQAGGGTVLIGGDTGGGNPTPAVASMAQAQLEPFAVPTATTVNVDAASVINASATGQGNGGKVVVWSNEATTFYGTILATGGPSGGNGGFVETSGHTLDFANARVDTAAIAGKTGTWLVDPTDLTVDSTAAATIVGNLGHTDVTLQTNANGTTSGPGTTSSGPGDIIVNSPISWTGGNTLSLLAYNDIAINAAISGPTGGLTLNAGNSISATAAVDVGTFNLQGGAWTQVTPNLPAFSATNLFVIYSGASFLRALGGDGSSGSPYQIADVYGLQGMEGFLSSNFVLANNIDASATANWTNQGGFYPIGSGAAPFSGTFDGNNNTISNLTLSRSNDLYVGLFGGIGPSGVVERVNLANTTVNAGNGGGTEFIGALAGINEGLIANDFANVSMNVGSNAWVGGLVGYNLGGTVSQSGVVGSLTTNSSIAGGLVGYNEGLISQSYWIASSTSISPVPGLTGYNEPNNFGTNSGPTPGTGVIQNSYALGPITTPGLVASYNQDGTVTNSYATGVGGLVGINYQGGAVSNSYWVTDSGLTPSDGSTALTTLQIKSGLPIGFDQTVWGSTPALNNGYPYLLWQFANSGPSTPILPPGVAPFPNLQTTQLVAPPNMQTAGWTPFISNAVLPLIPSSNNSQPNGELTTQAINSAAQTLLGTFVFQPLNTPSGGTYRWPAIANTPYQECTNFALALFNSISKSPLPGSQSNISTLGNATTWFANAAPYAKEIAAPSNSNNLNGVFSTVPVGSIIVWSGGADQLGHLAIVTSNSGGTMTILEANWQGNYVVDKATLSYATIASRPDYATSSTYTLEGFIVPSI
jgi:filamentous hemagglutinin family protein